MSGSGCGNTITSAMKVVDIENLKHVKDEKTETAKFEIMIEKNKDIYISILNEILEWIKTYETSDKMGTMKEEFNTYYNKVTKKHRVMCKKNILIYYYRQLLSKNKIEDHPKMWMLLQKRPARNISGVAVITVLTSPYPHGQSFSCKHDCYYCPNEPDQPRSYLKKEPAVARANRNEFDAIKQMNERMKTLVINGHDISKLEIIIEGGTYTEYPIEYLEEYHRDLIYSANTFYDDEERKREKYDVVTEAKINATAQVRIIGICIETRPDAIIDVGGEDPLIWLKFFRKVGVTRIQIGVQHTDNAILKKVNRGHSYELSLRAMAILKNNCFKVDIHLMPDLPDCTPEGDKEMFDIVFDNHKYGEKSLQPDQVKIYPCEVTPWTEIQKWYREGKYTPYAEKNERELLEVVKYGMKKCPPWVRLPRVIRDIPLSYIEGGNKYPNLRQMITDELYKEGVFIEDIREREYGRHLEYKPEEALLFIRQYEANEGTDYFLSFESEDNKCIFAFLRLRFPNPKSQSHKYIFEELKENPENKVALIRELHVYGNLVNVGNKKKCDSSSQAQHMGFGSELLDTANLIALAKGYDKTVVISGIGVVEYYKKRGFTESEYFLMYDLKNHECYGQKDYLAFTNMGLDLQEKICKRDKTNTEVIFGLSEKQKQEQQEKHKQDIKPKSYSKLYLCETYLYFTVSSVLVVSLILKIISVLYNKIISDNVYM